MACAWEAIAALPSVCGGTFTTALPVASADRANSKGKTSVSTDLWGCDEHAFCYSCSSGNPYCEAISLYYGGVDGGAEGGWISNHSAYAAVFALNANLTYWCNASTLAAIEAGYGTTVGLGGVEGYSDDHAPSGTTTSHEHSEACGKGCSKTVEDDDTAYDGNAGGATPPEGVGATTEGQTHVE